MLLPIRVVLTFLGCLLFGCMVGEGIQPYDDVEAGVVVLEGPALADELARSPVRTSERPFARLGMVFDADRPAAFEVSTSVDGTTWSPWTSPAIHHIELEKSAGFVAQVELPAPAKHYRLRAVAGAQPTFLRLEIMVFTQAESFEDGESPTGTVERSVGGVEVHPRSEWGARASNCSSSLGNVYRMAIHHTETPTNDSMSPAARLRQIQSYHMDVKGWCDIGYHYLMSRDGRLWDGRRDNLLGTHAGGANTGNLGVSVIGSHDATAITQVQVDSLARLIRALADLRGLTINRTTIKGHREYKSTSCPGDKLYGQLGTILTTARALPNGGGGGGGGGGAATSGTVRGVLFVGADIASRLTGATIKLGARTTITDTVGAWEFADVPAGSFTVTASKAGYITRSITRTTDGAETWASFGLSLAGSATGTAILQGVVYHGTSSTNRIANATISLSTGHTATADANGFYKITSLPAGDVTITARAAGYADASVARTLIDGQSEWGSVKLTAGSTTSQRWQPTAGTTWQYQLTGTIDTTIAATAFDIDLFDAPQAKIDALHALGRKVLCYLNAGGHEDWRSDAATFPAAAIGRPLDDWPGERWLDIRRADVRARIAARMDMAVTKRCDGVEPDNVDMFTRTAAQTGFAITAADQLDFNRFLAAAAHTRGLAVALKNDDGQVGQLVGDFDMAVVEQCAQYSECDQYTPFITAGKPVFLVEYTDQGATVGAVCPVASPLDFSTILKATVLDAPRTACP